MCLFSVASSFFFFKQKTAYEMRISDWSSDVCSSDLETRLLKVVPDEYRLDAHHWLILHGRYTCKARKPDCPHCVIRDLCRFPDKTQESPPAKPSAAKFASRRS